MGLPENNLVKQEEALRSLLNSITLVTRALTSVLNAETQQVRLAALQIKQSNMTDSEAVSLQKGILSIMQINCEMLIQLHFKLEKALEFTGQNPDLSALMEAIALEEKALTAFITAEKEIMQPLKEQMAANDSSSFQKVIDSILHTAEKMQMLCQFMKTI